MPDIYDRLRERLDMFPQGFPQTESGVELDILRQLFSPEEAEVMLYVKPSPETANIIADRMGRDETEMTEMLMSMSKKGLILRGTVEGFTFYLLAPWMVGIWEFQVNNLDLENIHLYEKFYNEGMAPSRKGIKTAGMRVIPIEQEIYAHTEVQPFEQVSRIIESSSRFGVAECICRKEARMLGEGCDKLLEACLMFDLAAAYYIDNGIGREITKEEAREILARAEESGLVHCSSNHVGDKAFICNCCGCCCKALAHITKHNNPAVIAGSNYYAVLDPQECTACEVCLDRCQVGAIRMNKETPVIEKNMCIGCGLCVSTCPVESISMSVKQPEEQSMVFQNQDEMLAALGKEKNKVYPFE